MRETRIRPGILHWVSAALLLFGLMLVVPGFAAFL